MKYILNIFLFVLSVHLAWDASTSETVTGYKVYYGTSTGNYSVVTNVGNVTDFTVSVDETQPIYFAVTAYNDTDESDYSTELSCSVINISTNGLGSYSIKQSDWSNGRNSKHTVVEKGTGKSTIISYYASPSYEIHSILNNNSWESLNNPYSFEPSISIHNVVFNFAKQHSLSGIEWIK